MFPNDDLFNMNMDISSRMRQMQEEMNQMNGFGRIGGFGGFSNFPSMDMNNDFPNMNINIDPNMQGSYTIQSFSSSSSTTNGGPATFSSQSYVSTVKDDGSGRGPQKELYENKKAGFIDQSGQKLEESQSRYKNSLTGVQKAAHERMLNDKGIKKMKEMNANTGEELEDATYENLDESKNILFFIILKYTIDTYSCI